MPSLEITSPLFLSGSQSLGAGGANPTRPMHGPMLRLPSLDVAVLDSMVRIALQYTLAPSTKRSYSSIQTRYLVFGSSLHLSPIPVSQDVLCKFVVWLAARGVSHSSIKGYLSAIRHLHITSLCQDPAIVCMAGLHYVLQAIKRIQSMTPATRPTVRLPVTAGVMHLLK